MTGTSQKFQRRTLQVMLALSMALLVWGLIRLGVDGVSHQAALLQFRDLDTIPEILTALVRAEPIALLAAGMGLIAITPALRLLILTIDFMAQKDALYVGVCVVVAAVIVIGGLVRLA